MSNKIYGIDVSSYQGKIDWNKVKAAGCGFAILKCIKKDLSLDEQFLANVAGCKANSIPIGVYTYVYENSKAGAVKRATAAAKACQKAGLKDCIIWWDVEERSIFKSGVENRKKNTDSVKAARKEILDCGYDFGVYCDRDFFSGMLNPSELGGRWWIAKYGKNPVAKFGDRPTGTKPDIKPEELCGWQYCSRGKVPGISGNVDLNIAYDSCFYETQSTQAHSGPAYDNVKNMDTLRAGDIGTQVRALQKLLIVVQVDGEFGYVTEAAVKAVQRAHSLKVDGIVGPKTWPYIIGG